MFDAENIKQAYARMSKQMKDFLLSDKSREFFIFLFFFFVAGGFWLLQTKELCCSTTCWAEAFILSL